MSDLDGIIRRTLHRIRGSSPKVPDFGDEPRSEGHSDQPAETRHRTDDLIVANDGVYQFRAFACLRLATDRDPKRSNSGLPEELPHDFPGLKSHACGRGPRPQMCDPLNTHLFSAVHGYGATGREPPSDSGHSKWRNGDSECNRLLNVSYDLGHED